MRGATLGWRLRQLFRPLHREGRYYQNYAHILEHGPGRLSIYRALKAAVGRRKALDLGCGTGYVTAWLGAEGADLNADALKVARARFPRTRFHQASLRHLLKGRRRWQALVLVNVVEHLPETERRGFLRSLKGLLSPGGRIFIVYDSMYHPLQLLSGLLHPGMLLTDPTHVRCWTQAGFRRELSQSLRIEAEQGGNILSRGLPFTDRFHTARLYTCRPL